jgi:3-methylcrotonyl-CoA carboxylase alpha subunit
VAIGGGAVVMSTSRRTYRSAAGDHVVSATEHDGVVSVQIDDVAADVTARLVRQFVSGAEIVLEGGEAPDRAVVLRDGDRVLVHLRGRTHVLGLVSRRGDAQHAADGDTEPFAASPMTGVVLRVDVQPGATVAAGAPLLVIEAMKMEFVVEAPRDVVVDEVLAAVGDRVDIGQVLVRFVETGTEDDGGGDAE